MFKPFLIALSCLSLVTLAACGGGAADPAAQQGSELYETRAGTVTASATRAGAAYQLKRDGLLIAELTAGNAAVNFSTHLNEEVEVTGIVRTAADGIETMEVVTIEPRTSGAPEQITYQSFEDATFGYTLQYPSIFTKRETRTGSTYELAGQKIIEVSTITNRTEKELANFLIDHYGYEASDLTRVSVGGLPGYQFQNASGSVVYLARGPVVYAIAWFDSDAADRERNRRLYLELIQSFQPTTGQAIDAPTVPTEGGVAAGLGEFCGGIAGISCATGLSCQLDGTHPDAGGVCVEAPGGALTGVETTATEVATNTDLSPITADEINRGWYYGDRDSKKPNTPDTWVLTNSGTRFAMWRRPAVEAEHTPSLAAPTATRDQLSANQQAVLDYLKGQIGTLAPEEPRSGSWTLVRVAFAEPSYVYATMRAGDAYRRLLFVYAVAGEQVRVDSNAYFKANATGAWIATEGVDTAAGKTLTVVDPQAAAAAVSGYQTYTNRFANYTLQYPEAWYWQNASRTRTEFSDMPFPRGSVRITAEVVDGSDFDFGEVQAAGSDVVAYLPLTDSQSVKISGGKGYAEQIGVMAQTFASVQQ